MAGRLQKTIVVGTIAALAAACADDSPTAPEGLQPSQAAQWEGYHTTPPPVTVCELIDFNGIDHGDPISQVAVFGLTLHVAVNSFAASDGSDPALPLVGWDTNTLPGPDNPSNPSYWEDDDLLWNGRGECPGCEGLNTIMLIQDARGFDPWGDSPWGGRITFTGDFSGYDYFIKSFTAVDIDAVETPARLFFDDTQVAAAETAGNGTVQSVTVTTTEKIDDSFSFVFGTEAVDAIRGSGGTDNVEICRTPKEKLGDEGCTLGFWKNHLSAWTSTGYEPTQTIESVFDVPDALGLDDYTLLQALQFGGGSSDAGAAQILLKQAVAALLNAASPDVDYSLRSTDIVLNTNVALASGERSAMILLGGALDVLNNKVCPINGKDVYDGAMKAGKEKHWRR